VPDRFRLVYRFPLPPTGNKSVRTGKGNHYTPAWIEAYRVLVFAERCLQDCKLPRMPETIDAQVGVVLTLPKFRGDLDNREKVLNDAITKAGIWKDDRLIRAKAVHIDESMPKDRCVVTICDLESFWPEVGTLAARMAEAAR
jgi:Holliday junction resolvase RusA-like endonuclease